MEVLDPSETYVALSHTSSLTSTYEHRLPNATSLFKVQGGTPRIARYGAVLRGTNNTVILRDARMTDISGKGLTIVSNKLREPMCCLVKISKNSLILSSRSVSLDKTTIYGQSTQKNQP